MRLFILLLSLLSIATSLSAQVRPVQFTAKKELPVIGNTTQTIAIRVKDFTDVTTTQFTLQWPASVFEFSSVSNYGLPNLDLTHFNIALAATGKLTFSWDDVTTQGLSLTDDTVIFRGIFQTSGSFRLFPKPQ